MELNEKDSDESAQSCNTEGDNNTFATRHFKVCCTLDMFQNDLIGSKIHKVSRNSYPCTLSLCFLLQLVCFAV